MSTRSAFRFDPRAIVGSFLTGVVFVVLFTWMTGNALGAPTFPLLAMISGFILAGATYGALSEGETVLEPALAAVLVAVAAYFIISALGLQAFDPLVSDGAFTYTMVVAFLNGLVLTFGGAWAGETLQRTYAESESAALSWDWVMAGTILGFAVSLFLVNFVIWGFSLFGNPAAAIDAPYAWVMLLVVFLGLEATGYVCAFRSPGDTSYEAAVAGLITLVLLIDVFVVALGGANILSYGRMALVLVIGLVASLVGGYIGERKQAQVESGRPSEA
ncbi:hypothetical protein [Salinibacter sp.]|uniref:hypothetical protein n=1 Tax=Salinibacter sp. TaxID=2065818 RepID=UPI0021E7B381|nr:hypothetical protein [Salinibacter sp.]